ncbi:hypothetical protein BDQ12DRAFT_660991 [Crucibulum laeve]|uniref:Uncharacterized protein n=1 Tax=Crucibulum laeve TaxID=68775 RepID=A0A5C3MHP7_9AGAR|nr:hypothetical protein BDQ12DRAFT_660991 [Crucibulum laeve]
MQKTSFLATLLLSIGLVFAADICTYTSRNCIGSYGCCYGIAEGTCCYWPANSGYGWSVKYSSMPTTPWWLGRAYGDLCTTLTSGSGSSSGSICASVYTGPTYINWVSANWDSDYRTRRSLEERGDTPQGDCVLPNVIGFTSDDGEEHLVKVPEGKFEEVNELVKADNFKELLKLDKVN